MTTTNVAILEEELLSLLEKAYEEGWYGSKDMGETVARRLIKDLMEDKFKVKTKASRPELTKQLIEECNQYSPPPADPSVLHRDDNISWLERYYDGGGGGWSGGDVSDNIENMQVSNAEEDHSVDPEDHNFENITEDITDGWDDDWDYNP